MATAGKSLSDYDASIVSDASPFQFAIVVSEWNDEITSKLLEGAHSTLIKLGATESSIQVIHVPGAFELPSGAQYILEAQAADAVICLGAVIRGETAHFDFVCEACASGIKDVGLKYNCPVIFGVLTDDTIEQSRARSGGELGNKGTEAAVSAVKMVALKAQLG